MNTTSAPIVTIARRRTAFTIVELLVVVVIIAVLIGLLFPVITTLKNGKNKALTNAQIMKLMIAMEQYASEDPRHFYPTPVASEFLTFDERGHAGVLYLLTRAGYTVQTQELDQVAPSGQPMYKALLDGWQRPLRYRLDGPRFVGAVVDAGSMNGTADTPAGAVVTDWNPKGKEPWAYVWSLGKPTKDGDTTDALPANAANWLYQKGYKQ